MAKTKAKARKTQKPIVVTPEMVRKLWPQACDDGLAWTFESYGRRGIPVSKSSYDLLDDVSVSHVFDFAESISGEDLDCPCLSCCESINESRRRFNRLVKLIDAELRERGYE